MVKIKNKNRRREEKSKLTSNFHLIQTFVKEPKEGGLKKNSVAVHKFLEELVAIEFPGSKAVSEASSKYGPALVPGPVLFVIEKVSTYIVTEEKVDEAPAEAKTSEEEASGKEKEIVVVEEEKKEEEEKIEVAAEAEKVEAAEAPPAYTTEPAKVEEAEPPKP